MLAIALSTMTGCASPWSKARTVRTASTHDGVTIHGHVYDAGVARDAPLVLLFHGNGASARSEFSELATWLNSAGFRAIAWDLRTGGDRDGVANLTADALPEDISTGACDSYPDLTAALRDVIAGGLAERVVLWGGGHAAALALRLAVEYPERVDGVVVFGPDGMDSCDGWGALEDLAVPGFVVMPVNESGGVFLLELRARSHDAGHFFHAIEFATGGSSLLLDRERSDVTDLRARVLMWLRIVTNTSP